jgi:glycosyltransferase involved in cell wall biosynthesis
MGDNIVVQAATPFISVIIPCFNSGQYLREAIASVELYSDSQVYEIIIVNDGSTDIATLELLQQLQGEGYQIIHQSNKGPAAARNTGVNTSRGKYLLLLDSDNKIRAAFIDVGLKVLDEQPGVGVVHGQAAFFGEAMQARFRPRPFDLYNILANNYIDMCTIIRRTAWEQVGGMDEARELIGHEDWEFWLRLYTNGWKFSFVNRVLFDYRMGSDSLVAQATQGDKYMRMRQYVYHKHWSLLAKAYGVLAEEYSAYQHDRDRPARSFAKYLYAKLRDKK